MGDQSESMGAAEPDAPPPAHTGGTRGTPALPSVTQLVHTHHVAVYRYAYRLVGRIPDAEDLTQQTFLIAQQKIDQIRDPSKVDRWLFAVLRSCFLKNRRRRRPATAANLDMDMDTVAVEPPAAEQIDGELLELAMNELSDQQRLILVMFYFDELSYKQIAGELGVPMGTVMSRLARAKSRLRELLAMRQSAARNR